SAMESISSRCGFLTILAPMDSIEATFLSTASVGTNTVHGAPTFFELQARACPWLPAETVTKPAARSSADDLDTLFQWPLTLKLPVGWRHSSFSLTRPSSNREPGTRGVRRTVPEILFMASSTMDGVTLGTSTFGNPPYLPLSGFTVNEGHPNL